MYSVIQNVVARKLTTLYVKIIYYPAAHDHSKRSAFSFLSLSNDLAAAVHTSTPIHQHTNTPAHPNG